VLLVIPSEAAVRLRSRDDSALGMTTMGQRFGGRASPTKVQPETPGWNGCQRIGPSRRAEVSRQRRHPADPFDPPHPDEPPSVMLAIGD
jgi:hypothetical protein